MGPDGDLHFVDGNAEDGRRGVRPADRPADGPLTRDAGFPGERPRLSRQRRATSFPFSPPARKGNRGTPQVHAGSRELGANGDDRCLRNDRR